MAEETKKRKTDMLWHAWYLAGLIGGCCGAMIAIYIIAQQRERIGTESMVWSIVGSLLMVPFVGVLTAIVAYMAVTG
jgi:uncharacterized membrane protein YeaQ/YmgE (transglycosylase-associated protein family)